MNNNQLTGPNDNRQMALIPAGQTVPATLDPYGPYGGYRGSPTDEPELFGFKIFDYWRILNKRKWLILGITAAFVALGAVRTLMQTPLYTATVRLQIDRTVAEVVKSGNVAPLENWDQDFMRTQYEVLQSRTMAERVASILQLGKDPDLLEPRSFSLTGAVMGLFSPSPSAHQPVDEKALERSAVWVILGNRTVSPVTGSNLVDVSYSDPV